MKVIVASSDFDPDVGVSSASGIYQAEKPKETYTFRIHFHLFESYIVHHI